VNSPVPLPGDFIAAPAKGAIDGANGASDTLMVALQAFEDCRGLKHGYGTDEEFFVVNEYFLDGTSLMCRGFDGRVLRGQKVATGNDADKAYVILDDVYSFQVVYGVTEGFSTTDNSARPVQFIPANELAVAEAAGSQVVAIRIAVLLKGDSDLIIDSPMQFKLLNEYAITPSEKRLFKQFETTITLRNSKNTIRSRNI
jgi:type IV pilus assembly protein PilW